MNDDEHKALLLEIAERQKAMEADLSDLVDGQAAALEKYAASDVAYREQLERYGRESEAMAGSRKLLTAVRLVALLLLAFIAYRVSR